MRCQKPWIATLLVIAAACGGGGGDDSGSSSTPNPNKGFGSVSIESPTNTGSHTTPNETAFIGGKAFISPTWQKCCSGSAEDTGVTVVWSINGGPQNSASQSTSYCSIFGVTFLCGHSWSAAVPVSVGASVVTVQASDPSGNIGFASITITRTPDVTPPTAGNFSPPNGSSNVSINASLSVAFSEKMDVGSIDASTFQLATAGGTPVAGTVTPSQFGATFHPQASLAGVTPYVATVKAGVKDVAGNAMGTDKTWTFTTGATPDTTPPTVTTVSPPDQSNCNPLELVLTAGFNENIQQSTVNTNSFTLRDANLNQVNGTVTSLSSTSFRFAPFSRLPFNTTFTGTLTTAIKDLAGNGLAANKTWSFTTVPSGIGTWQAINALNSPGGRTLHSAVWTGTEMIIWGGFQQSAQIQWLGDGAKYNPTMNAWTSVSNVGAPERRSGHAAVWTGQEMLIWGGNTFGADNFTGARYNPSTDAWQPMASSGVGLNGTLSAIWTGTEMILMANGFAMRYNPTSDTWQPVAGVSLNGLSPYFSGHSAVWTGTRMIIWGGSRAVGNSIITTYSDDGASYDPSTNTWEAIPSAGGPIARRDHRAVWTGSEMIVFGGFNGGGTLDSGALYDPVAKTWRAMQSCGASARSAHTAAWTGSEMIAWGGATQLGLSDTGQRYDPQTDSWQQISLTNAPSPTSTVTGVWTGSELMFWGGGVGARYQP